MKVGEKPRESFRGGKEDLEEDREGGGRCEERYRGEVASRRGEDGKVMWRGGGVSAILVTSR